MAYGRCSMFLKAPAPNRLGTRDWVRGEKFVHGPEGGMVSCAVCIPQMGLCSFARSSFCQATDRCWSTDRGLEVPCLKASTFVDLNSLKWRVHCCMKCKEETACDECVNTWVLENNISAAKLCVECLFPRVAHTIKGLIHHLSVCSFCGFIVGISKKVNMVTFRTVPVPGFKFICLGQNDNCPNDLWYICMSTGGKS